MWVSIIVILFFLAHGQTIDGYSQLRSFTGPKKTAFLGGYGIGNLTSCGFILGTEPAGSVTGPSSICQTRAGGVTCHVIQKEQNFNFLNLTGSSASLRLFVGAAFSAQYDGLPPSIYQLCDN